MGCKDCSVSEILSVRYRKEAIQGFVEGTGFSPGKTIYSIEQVTNITV